MPCSMSECIMLCLLDCQCGVSVGKQSLVHSFQVTVSNPTFTLPRCRCAPMTSSQAMTPPSPPPSPGVGVPL